MNIWFPVVLVICLVVFFSVSLIRSSNWNETEGVIQSYSVERSLLNSNRVFGDGERHHYTVDVQYTYKVDGKVYTGDRIYAAIPNTFSDPSILNLLAEKYSEGSTVTVYYNPDSVNSACLETMGKGKKGKILFFAFLCLIISALVYGLYMLNKFVF